MDLPPFINAVRKEPNVLKWIARCAEKPIATLLALGLTCHALDTPARDHAYRVLTIKTDSHVLIPVLDFLETSCVYRKRTREINLRGIDIEGIAPVIDEESVASLIGHFPRLQRLCVNHFRWIKDFYNPASASHLDDAWPTLPSTLRLHLSDMRPFVDGVNPYGIHSMFEELKGIFLVCTPTNKLPSGSLSGGVGHARSVSVRFHNHPPPHFDIPVFKDVRKMRLFNFSSAAARWTSEVVRENSETLQSFLCTIERASFCSDPTLDHFHFLADTRLSTFTLVSPALSFDKLPLSHHCLGTAAVPYFPSTLSTFCLILEFHSGDSMTIRTDDVNTLTERLHGIPWDHFFIMLSGSCSSPEVEIIIQNRGQPWAETNMLEVERTVMQLVHMSEDVVVSFVNA